MPANESIYSVIQAIPRGKVISYGQVASMAGLPRAARRVGTVLKALPQNTRLPWHRVINAQGRIAFPENSPGYKRQRQLLESEGVVFRNERIDWRQFGWRP